MVYKSPTQPYCRVCGKAIAKYTRHVWVKPEASRSHGGTFGETMYFTPEDYPLSKADCQRLTNLQVISVNYQTLYKEKPDGSWLYEDGERVVDRKVIYYFGTWDGESYRDEFFCNGDHAKQFAYMAARTYPLLRSTTAADAERMRKATGKAA